MKRLLLIAALGAMSPFSRAAMLDDFDDPSRWTAAPAEGVSLTIGSDAGAHGRAMRLDFDFGGHAGYAIARRPLDLTLPDNYAFSFSVRGECPANDLEFKLVDPSGENVWWVDQRAFEFPSAWRRIELKKRRISFAWGPAGGGELKRVGSIEFAITAGSGGKGTVWIDDLELTPLPAEHPYTRTPSLSATRSAPGGDPARALDRDPASSWESGPAGTDPVELSIDFGERREFGGLAIDWTGNRAADYDLLVSDDNTAWTTLRAVRGGEGPRDWLALGDAGARYVRLKLLRSTTGAYGIGELDVRPTAFGEGGNALFSAMAAAAPRGAYPRSWLGEQAYWTIVGVSGGAEDALFSEDGLLETGKGGPSLEPFVRWDEPTSWNGAVRSVSLLDGDLPIPSVTWSSPGFSLEVAALADGPAEAPTLRARYRLTNRGSAEHAATLLVALRPFQVNPPWQFLGTPGGVSKVSTIAWDGSRAIVDGWRAIVPSPPPDLVTARSFDSGDVAPRWLRGDPLEAVSRIEDPVGYASAGFLWKVSPLPPGGSFEVVLAVPLAGTPGHPPRAVEIAGGPRDFARRVEAARLSWRETLDRVGFRVPAAALPLVRTLRSNLAYTLINRHGAALQPGSRSYARSWIRDGALMAAALLRLGHAGEARAFAEWYAPYQFASGLVPCCVDARGADPVPENDSHGELIHLVSEIFRYTGDRSFLEAMWPHVSKAADAIDLLRRKRRTDEYRAPGKAAFYGLLPESISHEGYSDKPRHSYWDDFFAMTGLDDATRLADTLAKPAERDRIARVRDEFKSDLLASIEATMKMHAIDTLPGCVELGDFDPTSSTVALDPAGLLGVLPRGSVEKTFERYWENFTRRRDGATPWESYTPYELRTVGAFIRLGWSARAQEALAFFMGHRRPEAWNAWGEVVWNDPKTPKFVGDIPHTWVGTDFIRSFLDLFAYERKSDRALVIAAGIPDAWARAGEGVAIDRLRTPWGELSWSLVSRDRELRLTIAKGIDVPPGGIVFRPDRAQAPVAVLVNGRTVGLNADGAIVVRSVPADVRVRY